MFSTMGILSVAFTLIIGLNVVSIGTGQAAGTGKLRKKVNSKSFCVNILCKIYTRAHGGDSRTFLVK